MRKNYFILIFLLYFLTIKPATGESKVPIISEMGKVTFSQELDYSLKQSELGGLYFTISSNEEWLFSINQHPDKDKKDKNDPDYYIYLLHIPSQKTWTCPAPEGIPAIGPTWFPQWYPNCFSDDSKKIYFEQNAAEISPDMADLKFNKIEKPINMEKLEGTFLNFNGYVKDKNGNQIKNWIEILGATDGVGDIDYAWDMQGKVLCKFVKDSAKNFIRVLPQGINKEVDISKIIEIEKKDRNDFLAKSRKDMPEILKEFGVDENADEQTKLSAVKNFEKLLGLVEPVSEKSVFSLSWLAISPDNKYLAAIAAIEGHNYGVLIPLVKDGFMAYSFDKKVAGKMLWGKDSKRIYYYCERENETQKQKLNCLEINVDYFPEQNNLLEVQLDNNNDSTPPASTNLPIIETINQYDTGKSINITLFQNSTKYLDTTKTISDKLWWILVHPSNAPDGPGIFLYDETNNKILRKINLPIGTISPHALAFDGENLWLGDAASQGYPASSTIYQIDPMDGSVLSNIKILGGTAGITFAGTSLWYSQMWSGKLFNITKEGKLLKQLQMSVQTIDDIAFDGKWLYYAINDADDRIVRVDPNTGKEENFITNTVKSKAISTLAIDNNYLVVIDEPNNKLNQIRRFDRRTGNFISDTPIPLSGLITAIAPYYPQ